MADSLRNDYAADKPEHSTRTFTETVRGEKRKQPLCLQCPHPTTGDAAAPQPACDGTTAFFQFFDILLSMDVHQKLQRGCGSIFTSMEVRESFGGSTSVVPLSVEVEASMRFHIPRRASTYSHEYRELRAPSTRRP